VQIKPEYLDLAAASAYTSLSVRSLRRLISAPGGLPHYRVRGCGKILVRRRDLEAFMEQFRREALSLDEMADALVKELCQR